MKGNGEVSKKKKSAVGAVFQTAIFLVAMIGLPLGLVFFASVYTSETEPRFEDYQYVSMNELADFNYRRPFLRKKDEGNGGGGENPIPEKIMRLNERKVTLTGYMLPVRVDSEGYVEEFALNGNYDMCFFGVPSSPNYWVHIRMQPGRKARFSHNPTTVSGTLEVGELIEDGEVVSLYRLTGEKASTASRSLF